MRWAARRTGSAVEPRVRDLRAAVERLRADIAVFGGDPERIVLIGESAGSGRVGHLLATGDLPVAGAILQSGAVAGALTPRPRPGSASSSSTPPVPHRRPTSRSVPVDVLLAAQEQTVEAALVKVGMTPFHPWVDGDLLTTPADRVGLPAIPLVVGTTAHEMELFRDQVPALPDDIAAMYLAGKATNLGITDETCVRAVFERHVGVTSSRRSPTSSSTYPTSCWRARTRRAGNLVYRYRFGWEAPARRACYAVDPPFTFGTLDVSTWRASRAPTARGPLLA